MKQTIFNDEYAVSESSAIETDLPSQQTYGEMENLTSITTAELRAAPPDGTPIGSIPLESPTAFIMLIPFVLYLIIKRRKLRRTIN